MLAAELTNWFLSNSDMLKAADPRDENDVEGAGTDEAISHALSGETEKSPVQVDIQSSGVDGSFSLGSETDQRTWKSRVEQQGRRLSTESNEQWESEEHEVDSYDALPNNRGRRIFSHRKKKRPIVRERKMVPVQSPHHTRPIKKPQHINWILARSGIV